MEKFDVPTNNRFSRKTQPHPTRRRPHWTQDRLHAMQSHIRRQHDVLRERDPNRPRVKPTLVAARPRDGGAS